METVAEKSTPEWFAPVRRAARAVAALVYPPVCRGCGRLAAGHDGFCAACWPQLRFIERPYCEVMGTPFQYDMGAGILSADAISNPPPFERARAAVVYDGSARNLVHALKYRDRTDLANMMARWMLRAGGDEIASCDAILAVPLHRWRMLARRYNQSAELARALAKLSVKPYLATGLVRTRPTRQQVGLAIRQREDNVRGAFRVDEAALPSIAGKRLVLVDDVYTTGATAAAVTRALKKAGAAEVTVLTFARVVPGHI